MNLLILMVMSGLVLSAGGCNQKDVIPERLEGKVDQDLRYSDIKTNPETHKGKLMLAGGRVLSAKRTQAGTRIEVLQIPLSDDLIPTGRDTESKGRFVAIDSNGDQVADPAVFDDDNKRVTVVGEVLGMTTVQIDDVQQQVPQLAIKHITVWDLDQMQSGYSRPYAGYGYPYGWGGGYRGYYGHPYYW